MQQIEWLGLSQIKALFVIMLAACLPLEHTPALRYLCVVVIAVLGLVRLRELKWSELGWVVYPAAAWVIFSLASLFWSVEPNLTQRHWFSDVLIPLLALFGAWSCVEKTSKLLKPCLLIYTWALFLTAIGYLAGIDFLAYYYVGVGVSSTLALLVIPLWVGLFSNANATWRWVSAGHLLMLLLVGLISGNRMFWVVLMAVLPLFALLRYSLSVKKTLLLTIAGLLAVSAPLYFIYLWRFQGAGGFSGFGSMYAHDARFVIWRYWFSLAWQHPWLGIGFGRGILNYLYGGSVPAELIAVDKFIVAHGHNVFLNVFLELGIVGVVIYATLVIGLLCKAYSAFKAVRMDIFWAAPFLSLLAVLLKNQTDDYLIFATPATAMFFLGMALAYRRYFSTLTPSHSV